MPIQLGKVLAESGATSVRDLFKKTGSSETSLYRQCQVAAIDSFYRKNGGIRGPFGFPLGEVEFEGLRARRSYAGGYIPFLNGPQGPSKTWAVDVRYIGFECVRESDWDQASGADEPYFLIGVVGTNGSKTVKFGPYEDINSGSVRHEASLVVAANDLSISPRIVPPLVLAVAIMEHDYGSPQEAEEKVRKAIKEVEAKVDQAAAAFMGASTTNHVMPEWLRDIVIGWVPEIGASLLGLADDEVGKMPQVLFDYKPTGNWAQPPEIGTHGLNKYTHKIPVDGGAQGSYNVFFHVRIWEVPAPVLAPY